MIPVDFLVNARVIDLHDVAVDVDTVRHVDRVLENPPKPLGRRGPTVAGRTVSPPARPFRVVLIERLKRFANMSSASTHCREFEEELVQIYQE